MTQMNFCPYCGTALKTTMIDARERRICTREGCPYVHWDNPTPVVAALVEYHGEIVLARNKTWPEGMFGLLTGFLERGETPEQAVVREVKEELGLDATGVDFIGVYTFEQMNQLNVAYHVVVGMGAMTLSEELAEVKTLPPEKVQPWNFGTGLAVRDWLNRNRMSRF